MLTLSTARAVPGMVLALPVLHPQLPGHVLLKPGAVLDELTIERLKELGVRALCIAYPQTEFLLRYVSPAIIAEQSRLAATISDELDRRMSNLHAEFDFSLYTQNIRSLMARLVDDPAAALFMSDIVDPRHALASHSFNVGFLSMLMGLRLDGYLVASRPRITGKRATNIENLGLGAVLHDVGMLLLAPDVRQRFEQTRDETDHAWQKHVLAGFGLVRGKISPTAAGCVLHHHQRMDGSGFPRRVRGFGPPTALSGREIHIFARIVAVADVFDRFRSEPLGVPGQTGTSPTVRALKRTLELVRTGKLDPIVFKALVTVVPAFAPGSLVTLNSGQRCVVTGWDPARPCRPSVCPLWAGPDGPTRLGREQSISLPNVPLGEPIDLTDRRDLSIVEAEGVNVTKDLFEPRTPGEFDLRRQFAPVFEGGYDAVSDQTLDAMTRAVKAAV